MFSKISVYTEKVFDMDRQRLNFRMHILIRKRHKVMYLLNTGEISQTNAADRIIKIYDELQLILKQLSRLTFQIADETDRNIRMRNKYLRSLNKN